MSCESAVEGCQTSQTCPTRPTGLTLWSALESSRGLLSVSACWRFRLGEYYEFFRTAFLSKNPQPTKYYPCPRACGCMHEIIWIERSARPPASDQSAPSDESDASDLFHAPRSHTPVFAVCRCDEPHCPDIPLAPEEAILLEPSWSKLARALCAALNLDSRPLDLGLLNTRQIGSWSSNAVPVILTIQTDHAWFRGVLLELIARLRQRFILLAPTNRHFDAICHELVENAGAGFFALENIVGLLPSGLLQPLKTPGELFARFMPDPALEPNEDVARQAFALVEQLDSDAGSKPPTPMSVFRLYCMEGLSAGRIARRLRCSKPTVLRRLKLIERRIGVAPEKLRCYSNHLERFEDEARDHRAREIMRHDQLL